jgi:site-specific recombinase XerD
MFKKANFYLDKESVFLQYYWGKGKFVRYYIGLSVDPQHWSKKRQRLKSSFGSLSTEYNKMLQALADEARRIHLEYFNQGRIADLTPTLFRQHLQEWQEGKRKTTDGKNLFEFIGELIAERKADPTYSQSSIKTYNTTLNKLLAFNPALDFRDVDYKFFQDWKAHLLKQDFRDNYIHKLITTFRMFMEQATKRGVNTNTDYRDVRLKDDLKIKKRRGFKVALSLDEIKQILYTPLPEHLRRTRAIFVISCLTGIRYSDWGMMTWENLLNAIQVEGYEFLEMMPKKTDEEETVSFAPICNVAGIIVFLMQGFKPTKTSQPTNRDLKEIGRIAKLDREVTKRSRKGGKMIEERVKVYEMLSTHVGRNSFGTNCRQYGLADHLIKFMGGWKQKEMLDTYDRMQVEEKCRLIVPMLQSWDEVLWDDRLDHLEGFAYFLTGKELKTRSDQFRTIIGRVKRLAALYEIERGKMIQEGREPKPSEIQKRVDKILKDNKG